MDTNAQDQRDSMGDEFEPIELGSVSEETKGFRPNGMEGGVTPNSFQ